MRHQKHCATRGPRAAVAGHAPACTCNSKLTARDVTVTHEPPDGWWIDLPYGWVMDDGSHGIAEDTKRAALAKLDLAQPCQCAECEDGKRRFHV